MLVGAIVGVAVLNLTTGQAFIYGETRLLAQSMTGAYIGCMVTREDVKCLPKLIRPYLTVMSCLLVLNLIMGYVIYAVTDFDLLTCLFCAAPGGLADTPLIAQDMGADAPVVLVMQLIRMLFGLGCLPTIIMLSDRMIEPEVAKKMECHAAKLHHGRQVKVQPSFRAFLPTLAVALVAGVLGKLTGLPAGAMSAGLIATTALKLSGKGKLMPVWLRRVAQVISGCCIGSTITSEQLLQMRQLVLPAVLLCLGYISCCIGAGILVARLFKMDLREAMLTLAPAGASEMALIAADLGVESTNLVVIQICRLMGVMLFFPYIFRFILLLVG